MQDEMTVIPKSTFRSVSDDVTVSQPDLRKRPRIGETLIQAFLFLAGALSILTTVGIVYELSKESLSFFTRQQWENTNKQLVATMDADMTTFQISESGVTLLEGDVIRVSDEVMKIIGAEGDTIVVERGWQGTEAVPHQAGNDLFLSNRVSLFEFFSGTKWNPQIGQFGIWPLVTATLMTSTIAMLVALP